jgi:F420-dependent oxidoreductase-like protein
VKIGVHVARDSPDDWESAASFAAEAERLGVDSIWSAETWGFDGATPLAYIASRTSHVRLGTSILQIGARTPALTAMTAMALASMTNDRFILGLGLSNPQILEAWHGIHFEHPVARTRELIEIIRIISSRDRLEYDGRLHHIPVSDNRRSMRSAAQARHIPIHVASVGPRNLRLTGELADGWIGNCFVTDTGKSAFLDPLREGAEAAGRSFDELVLQLPVTLEFDDDIAAVTKRHAVGFAFTFGAMGDPQRNFYVEAFARQGFDVVREVQRLWLDGQREAAEELVPLEIAEKTNLLGTEDTVRDRLRTYRDLGIHSLRVGLRGINNHQRLAQLERLMPLVAEVESESVAVSEMS